MTGGYQEFAYTSKELIKGDQIGDGQIDATKLSLGLFQQIELVKTHTHDGVNSGRFASTNLIYPQWVTYTPSLVQTNAIPFTTAVARYTVIGSAVLVEMRLEITGAGSAGVNVQFTLPLSPKTVYNHVIGIGGYNDASVGTYFSVVMTNNNGPWCILQPTSITTGGAVVGTNPNLAAANGDCLLASVMYEKA